MSMKKKMEWSKRPRVRNCDHRDYYDCPRCGCGESCTHKDVGDDDCSEAVCPLWDGRRWKKEDA